VRPRRLAASLGLTLAASLVAVRAIPVSAVHGGDTEVTVGSNDLVFSQNKQNEPAIAIDPSEPSVVVAGANDNLDLEACGAGDPTTCPFTENVGVTGVQFSFDSGDTWVQAAYTGWTARHCLGPDECVPEAGPIGTLPGFFEAGLVSDGDPAMAFGPQPGEDGSFSWDNGSRLYFATLTSRHSAVSVEEPFRGFEAIAVSRLDGEEGGSLTPDIVADQSNWLPPVIASQRQSGTTFADKEQIWVDNAESSPFFGNVYVCFAQFRSAAFAAAPLMVSRSEDGGDTWLQRQVTGAHNVPPTRWGQSGCTIRTDSEGTAYVLFEQFQSPFRFLPPEGTLMMVRSTDGGRSWTRPEPVVDVTDPCFFVDPITFRCVMDGVAGARNDLSAAPSVDIANGAPTGQGATDEIVLTWVDGRDGLNDEHVMFSYSTDGGETWADPVAVESDPGDRGYYSAPAISPDGTDVYLVYNAFLTPFQEDTSQPRLIVGVVLHSDIDAEGAPTGWTELHRGDPGDARGSSQNNLVAGFLGDYVYADATNDVAVAVWNDAREASNCEAIDEWRMTIREDDPSAAPPAVQDECQTTFGNTDIFGWSGADPT